MGSIEITEGQQLITLPVSDIEIRILKERDLFLDLCLFDPDVDVKETAMQIREFAKAQKPILLVPPSLPSILAKVHVTNNMYVFRLQEATTNRRAAVEAAKKERKEK